MKRIAVLGLGVLMSLAVISQNEVIRDANAQVRNVGSFHAIRVSGGIDLYLSQGASEAVAVSAARDEYRDHIRTTVENGVLRIWYDEPGHWWNRMSSRKLRAYVSVKDIDRLDASGASDVTVEGSIKANELTIHLSGASDWKQGDIQANRLSINISGASDVKNLSGKVTNLTIQASGASDFKGYDLQTENCSAVASGASDIHVTVNNELNVRASGASDVYYKGQGRIRDLKTSGSSSVSRRS